MQLYVNGKTITLEADLNPVSVDFLLEHLKIKSAGVVVEKNGVIIERNNYAAEKLSDGDTLEIVRFVGGG